MGTIDLDNFKGMQEYVGGHVEAVNGGIEGEEFTLFINEQGKFSDLEPNVVASALVADGLMPGDYIAGNAVLVGPPGPEGETIAPPQNLVDGLSLALNA